MSDAFIVCGDFVSEHFFTSDSAKESFKSFVLEQQRTSAELGDSPKSRFAKVRNELSSELARVSEQIGNPRATTSKKAAADDEIKLAYGHIREILGYQTGEFVVNTVGPISWINTPGVENDAPLIIVHSKPAETVEDIISGDLLTGWHAGEKITETSTAKALSRIFNDAGAPEFALVLAGRWAMVTEQARWAEGRYIAVDLQTVADRNETKAGGEVDRAMTILGAESLAPDAEGQILWSKILEASVKHAVGVSKDLRDGVRRSIEIIANEVIARRREQGLVDLQPEQAQPLARQALRFLYRILFLLYAEASSELGVLPVGAVEYGNGYSVDRLRELTLVELVSPHSRKGTHLYESLEVLFRLVDKGNLTDLENEQTDGLVFNPLRADLFAPEAICLISETKLGNLALQQVLRYLLLSKEESGKERGFISYVELGINQLGAVYEGLMSYTGFFAMEDLYEVARGGDASKGSWVVPASRINGLAESDFVTETDPETGEKRPVLHRKGSFVYRLSGRERQQSASYYTPEVLTKFTVNQALEELITDQSSAEDILHLTVCEPALGSGAFAIESVNQLAEQYLSRRQKELGKKIDPQDYQGEFAKVKAYLALHNVYGVDLNSTAVEFAEITLWLATMAKGLAAPWFGLHLRRGNSLIGARHAFYSPDQLGKGKRWQIEPPARLPLHELAGSVKEDRTPGDLDVMIHHFLLPAKGWGSTADSGEAKKIVPDEVKKLKEWRSSVRGQLSKKQKVTLSLVARQTEQLWALALERLQIANNESRRSIKLWGREVTEPVSVVTREQIESSLADPNGAYQRLKRVMDAWCALWFWPLTQEARSVEGQVASPPSIDEWVSALRDIIGVSRPDGPQEPLLSLSGLAPWDQLAEREDAVIKLGNAMPIEQVLNDFPWLKVCEKIAREQGFFHWELIFAPVFAQGGFDLQVGNPPWVRPRGDVAALLAEGDPWWVLANKPSQAEINVKKPKTLQLSGVSDLVVTGDSEQSATAAYVGGTTNFPFLKGLQPDFYRCFMETTWSHASDNGIIALLHPETHFTDEKAGVLRKETYRRLRRHWQFVNELRLFDEVHHLVSYGVHVYGPPQEVNFMQATGLYHPTTVLGSLRHNSEGSAPGTKFEGHWDLRPHAARIQRVDDQMLSVWRDTLEPELDDYRQTRMVYTVNRDAGDVLAILSKAGRMSELNLNFSRGWDESIDRQKGYFIQEWGAPETWDDVILQGPHIHVANPFYKQPNQTMKNNLDWSDVDLETLPEDAIPVTTYKPVRGGVSRSYDADYTHWSDEPARDSYRVAWRCMAANTGERTLMPAIIPPGAAHVHAVASSRPKDIRELPVMAGVMASMLDDFSIRSVPKSTISPSTISRLPLPDRRHPLMPALALRALRLNCLASAYADLWSECWQDDFAEDSFVPKSNVFSSLGAVGPVWDYETPLRLAADRRQALVEIDALVALMLGVSAEQLCSVYRTQFAVLYGYDTGTSAQGGNYFFDANGRVVPPQVLKLWKEKDAVMTLEERTATNASGNVYVYELPFAIYDREADMTAAYNHFNARI